MKVYVLMFLAFAALNSCVSVPTQGDRIPEDKVFLVGKIDPGLDIKSFFGLEDEKEVGLRVYWNEYPPEIATAATAHLTYSPNDNYFILAVPRKSKLYLREMMFVPKVSIGDQIQLRYDYEKLAVSIPDGEQFVYIGDFRIAYKNDEPALFLEDKYETALKEFTNYFKDGKGGYAKLVKSISEGSLNVTATRVTNRVYVRRVYQ